jgi:DNA polymerase-3 subunit gamma/tau
MDRGREPLVVLQNLAGFYRDLLIARTAPNRSDLVAVTPPTWKQLCEFAQQRDVSSILQGQQHLKNSEAQIKNTTQPRLWLEVTLLGLLPSAKSSQAVETSVTSSRTPLVQRSDNSQTLRSENRETPASRLPQNQLENAKLPVTPQTDSVSAETVQKLESATFRAEEQIQQQPVVSAIDTSTTAVSPTPSQVPSASVRREQPETHSSVSDSIVREAAPSVVDTQATGLEQAWQKVLNQIKLFSTKELLRQHCCLVAFEGQQANIGISSKGLLKLAQTKLPEVEAAFQVVYKSKVRVNLQLVNSIASNTNAAKFGASEHDAVSVSEAGRDRAQVRESPSTSSSGTPTLTRESELPRRESDPHKQATSTELPTSQSIPKEPTLQSVVIRPATNYPSIEPVKSVPSSSIQTFAPENSVSRAEPSPASLKDLAGARTHTTGPPQAEVERSFSRPMTAVTPSSTPSSLQQVEECDTNAAEKALGALKQFFEGEIVDLTDEFRLSTPLIAQQPQLEEVFDDATEQREPEPEQYNSFSPMALEELDSDNPQDLPELGNAQEDDEEDIPF